MISVYDSYFRNVIHIVLLPFIALISQSQGMFISVRGDTLDCIKPVYQTALFITMFSRTHMLTQQKFTSCVSSDFATSATREFISSLCLLMNAIKNGCPLLKYVGKFNGVNSP